MESSLNLWRSQQAKLTVAISRNIGCRKDLEPPEGQGSLTELTQCLTSARFRTRVGCFHFGPGGATVPHTAALGQSASHTNRLWLLQPTQKFGKISLHRLGAFLAPQLLPPSTTQSTRSLPHFQGRKGIMGRVVSKPHSHSFRISRLDSTTRPRLRRPTDRFATSVWNLHKRRGC